MSIIGQLTKQVLELDLKKMNTRRRLTLTRKKQNDEGFASVQASMQHPDAPKLESLIGTRIEYLSSNETDKAGSEKNVLWMGGTVEKVSDGTWLMPRASTKYYY